MSLLKIFFKLLLIPLIIVITLIQWMGIFITQFSAVIFNLISGLLFLTAIAGFMFGICVGSETIKILVIGFGVFIVPHISEWIIIRIAAVNYKLRDFIKS